MSFERMSRDQAEDARERPRIAPDIVVEIWSPGDRRRKIEGKIALYLDNGCRLVMLVHPKRRTLAFHAPAADPVVVAAAGVVSCPVYDKLALNTDVLFADL
jgi:Uma2 family endonuclease